MTVFYNGKLRVLYQCAILLVTLIIPCSLFAADDVKTWVTFTDTPSSSMTISCQQSTETDDITLEYGETALYGTTLNFSAKENLAGDVKWVYHFKLENLKPDTHYHYAINIGSSQTGDFTFKTAPDDPCKPFSFIAMGDNRSQGKGSAYGSEFLEAAKNTGADFMVNTGDMVNDGDEINQWEDYLNETYRVARTTPIMPAIGNHDDGPGEGNVQNVTRIFYTPDNNDEGNRSYYSFEYGNAFFAVVNNHDTAPATQAAWLENQLKNTTAMWKFVFVHEPFFTCPALFGLLGHEADESDVGKYYFDIFEDYKVDMVFTGHNHMYELFKPNNTGGFVDDPSFGTIHITTGGAAESEAVAMMIEPALYCEGRIKQGDNIHFLKISIDKNNLELKYYPRGRLGGAPEEPKVQYNITKDQDLDCSGDPPEDGDVDMDEEVSDVDETETDNPEQEIEQEEQQVEDGDQDLMETICTPDQTQCDGTKLLECNKEGTSWNLITDCGDRDCQDGACLEVSEDGDLDQAESSDTIENSDEETIISGSSSSGCQNINHPNNNMLFWVIMLALFIVSSRRSAKG